MLKSPLYATRFTMSRKASPDCPNPECASLSDPDLKDVAKWGRVGGRQRYKCRVCDRQFVETDNPNLSLRGRKTGSTKTPGDPKAYKLDSRIRKSLGDRIEAIRSTTGETKPEIEERLIELGLEVAESSPKLQIPA